MARKSKSGAQISRTGDLEKELSFLLNGASCARLRCWEKQTPQICLRFEATRGHHNRRVGDHCAVGK
jgi:hypothetical protein